MRLMRTCGLAFGLVLGALLPASAQQHCGGNVLGVSRTVEIDTSTGPRFGFQYQHERSFLNDGEVVLTFDDGPLRAYTKPVLDALDAQCTKATFFAVGRMAVADPDMVKEYVRRGHTLGTHTWSHQKLAQLTPLKARAEIEMGFSAVQKALGQPVAPFFRFPYLAYSGSMATHLQNRQIATFSIDIDSQDFRTRDPVTVHRTVMGGLAKQRKGILLFHDIQPSTARALPGLLADLKAKGFRVVHIRPKAAVATLVDFDAVAQAEFGKRSGAGALRRASGWMAPLEEPLPTSVAKTDVVQSQQITEPKPATSPAPRLRGVVEDDWKTGVWRSN